MLYRPEGPGARLSADAAASPMRPVERLRARVWKPCVRRLRGRGFVRRRLVHSAAQPESSQL